MLALTADHGHVDVDASRTVYLNHVWPGLEPFLRRWSIGPAVGPGGSPRDCFLYLADHKDVEEVTARLGEKLAGVADVWPTASLAERGLFGPRPSNRLLDRAGDVAVLPVRGQTVWWFDPVSFRNTYLGRHGGLSEEEAVVPFAAIVR